MKTLKIAHRGAKGYAPENTIAAFRKAMDLQCDGIELDVHISSDGEVVVIHDETTDRVTGIPGVVSELTSAELQKLDVAGEKIPLLHEVIDFVGKNHLINIELKSSEAANPVISMIERYVAKGHNYKQFLVSSFDWTLLQNVREKDSRIPIGVLALSDIDLAIGFAEFIEAETIHPYYHLLNAENTAAMLQKGFKVFTWTVNEPEDIQLVKSLNVSGIISDFPDRI